jgi:hypothetical protein
MLSGIVGISCVESVMAAPSFAAPYGVT